MFSHAANPGGVQDGQTGQDHHRQHLPRVQLTARLTAFEEPHSHPGCYSRGLRFRKCASRLFRKCAPPRYLMTSPAVPPASRSASGISENARCNVRDWPDSHQKCVTCARYETTLRAFSELGSALRAAAQGDSCTRRRRANFPRAFSAATEPSATCNPANLARIFGSTNALLNAHFRKI